MATALETDNTVSSGSETKSGNENDSGAKPRDETQGADNRANPGIEAGPSAEIKTDSAGAVPSSPSGEPLKAGAEGEPSLGKTLIAVRERRGLSRDEVIAETRIPAHYIAMIESSDYGLISDQLYLMPFLRRYAAFLKLDGEEVAMRFVREVQRAEGAAVPRMSEPLALHNHRRAPWGRVAAVIIVISAIVVLYVIASGHHRGEFAFRHAAPAAEAIAPSAAIPPPPAVAPAAPAPIPAPAPQSAVAPRMPQTGDASGPTAPAAEPPKQKTPPSGAAAPADSEPE